MARTFRIYNGSDMLKEGASPNVLDALKPETTYNLSISVVEDGKESAKVAVPEFTTQAVPVAVTGVTITPKTAEVEVGATTQLTATVAPAKATNKKVTFSSSDKEVATVGTDGTVSGIAAGEATITVTTEDGAKTGTAVITVAEAPAK
ncbi:Ig-like virion protein [Enterococcus phage EH93P2]|nr:Ig-like virion protein [Enterococcus phage EH93P1]WAX15887.1 Ig-like virion protein [Enterococcus phage EH93P2]